MKHPIKEALNSFGFILPFHQEISAQQFASMIKKFCTAPQAEALALEISNYSGVSVIRERCFTTINYRYGGV